MSFFLPATSMSTRDLNFFPWDYRFLDPLTSGEYPDSMRSLVGARLPRFSSEEAKDLKGSFDFLGYNYYSTDFTVNNPTPQNFLNTDYVLDARANISGKLNMYRFNHLISLQIGQSDFNTSSNSWYLILLWY
jgi:beta-glucosidase/6-phospho-beta-glucosidase/beta-galactosidase